MTITKRVAKRIAQDLNTLGIPVSYLHCMGDAMTVVRQVNELDPALAKYPDRDCTKDMDEVREIFDRTAITTAIIFR